MPISTKKFVVDDRTYKIKHHPATEACELIENYATAISAFSVVMQEGTYSFMNNQIMPLAGFASSQFLALLMFIDRVANPNAPYKVFERPSSDTRGSKLTVREVLAGNTLEDREEVVEAHVQAPMSYVIDYKATNKQEASTDFDSVFGEFFKYITLDDEPVDVSSLTMPQIAQMLYAFVGHNVAPVWNTVRFALPENYDSGGIAPPKSLERSAAGFSQAGIIYSILNSQLDLATYAELSTCLNLEDAHDMNEIAVKQYFESCEMHKESVRQAKQNQ
ncbi:hypothetical protein [Pseudomonas fluorescens]|uniref:Uncharacterized protein n=2 Tax=Pseudomonas fluorescens TaxID=294 RepID=A0ABY1TJH1_PSEFL|nr:hypothetical protein [Pseudomonas fluorescens]MCI4606905.1 hypothetical protein [Pseudomonas fluorescens]PQB02256.1 hypothetical protein B0A76_02815 [Pseudomonas fluorescens]RFP95764.1 hypothetical protein D0N73_12960 [Pseudomonas fluorescens]SNY13286.1 hypothetical protein SAMN04488487_5438 [Pseudomonas fluorescens]SQF91893.1 Uncharacterised protein [Pseudomonas fluorescens]